MQIVGYGADTHDPINVGGMKMPWHEIVSIVLNVVLFIGNIIMFIWAYNEKSKRRSLWWTMKGLETSAFSQLSFHTNIRSKYEQDQRNSLPKEEFITHLDHELGHWDSHRQMIIGIRQSVSPEDKEENENST